MWIFGYGSLMTDGWETRYGCTRRDVAELHGYRRVFNKASIVNWGTRGSPCPTLNLEAFAGALCVGIAFEFPGVQRAEVVTYLAKREGKGFILAPLEVVVRGVGSAHALVPLYTGKNILTPETAQELVATVQRACGTSGACSNYVIDVYNQLAKLGIEDLAVTQLREHLRALGLGE